MTFSRLAIVLGLSPTGLYAVRELAQTGVPVLGITDSFSCGQFSRFLSHPDKFWVITDLDKLLQRLLALAENSSEPPVLIPTSDLFIDFIAGHSSQLKPHFIFQDSYASGLALSIMDKSSFHELCCKHNISTPLVWVASSGDELLELSAKAVFPCILKPRLIHEARTFMQGKKVLLVKSRDEFDTVAISIPKQSGGWLVQEVIPGPESNIFLFAGYFDTNGQPVRTFTARKLRQYPPGFGSASLVQSEIQKEVLEISVSFLQAVNFKGLCGTEFKFDPRDNTFKIIEINPRPTLWFNIANKAGKRFVKAAYMDLTGNTVTPEQQHEEGITWRYWFKDMYSKLFYMRWGKHFIFPPPDINERITSVTKRSWAVFDWRDPLPALIEPLQFLKKLIKRSGS